MFNGMDNTNSTTHANVSMFWSQHKEKKGEKKTISLSLVCVCVSLFLKKNRGKNREKYTI